MFNRGYSSRMAKRCGFSKPNRTSDLTIMYVLELILKISNGNLVFV